VTKAGASEDTALAFLFANFFEPIFFFLPRYLVKQLMLGEGRLPMARPFGKKIKKIAAWGFGVLLTGIAILITLNLWSSHLFV
jgi:hypothetical protein